MYGVKQKVLVKTLARMAAKCCAYIGDRCDCKFIDDSIPNERIMTHSEAGSGCPELMNLAHMVAAMTEQEFNVISQRAGISFPEDPADTIDASAIIREQRQSRKKALLPETKLKKVKERVEESYDRFYKSNDSYDKYGK
jgi:hypothetical protein